MELLPGCAHPHGTPLLKGKTISNFHFSGQHVSFQERIGRYNTRCFNPMRSMRVVYLHHLWEIFVGYYLPTICALDL